MTNAEIVAEYQQAKDKRARVGILATLPAGSSEAACAAACDLIRCLLWDAITGGGIDPTSNASACADPS